MIIFQKQLLPYQTYTKAYCLSKLPVLDLASVLFRPKIDIPGLLSS